MFSSESTLEQKLLSDNFRVQRGSIGSIDCI
jgi:hypothetical protein